MCMHVSLLCVNMSRYVCTAVDMCVYVYMFVDVNMCICADVNKCG